MKHSRRSINIGKDKRGSLITGTSTYQLCSPLQTWQFCRGANNRNCECFKRSHIHNNHELFDLTMQLQITASFYPRIIFKTRCLFDISWTRILHQISVHPIIHEFGETLDRWLDGVWRRNLLDNFQARFILSCCVQLDHFRLILLHCLHFALPFLLLRSCTLLLFVNLFVPSQPA